MTESDHPSGFDVDTEILRFARRARTYAMSHIAEVHEELDYGTFLLLVAICDGKRTGVRASELAEEMQVHKSTVSRAVSTLERLDLIRRATHPEDGRAQLLTVTDDARRRVNEFRARGQDQLAEILSDWSSEELATFARQLGRLNDAAEKID